MIGSAWTNRFCSPNEILLRFASSSSWCAVWCGWKGGGARVWRSFEVCLSGIPAYNLLSTLYVCLLATFRDVWKWSWNRTRCIFALSRIANECSQYTYMRWENLDHIDIYANLSHRVYFQYLCIYAIYSICSICHMMWHSLHANKHKPPQRNFRVDTTNNNLNGKSCFALLRASCRVYYYIWRVLGCRAIANYPPLYIELGLIKHSFSRATHTHWWRQRVVWQEMGCSMLY